MSIILDGSSHGWFLSNKPSGVTASVKYIPIKSELEHGMITVTEGCRRERWGGEIKQQLEHIQNI